MCFPKSTDTNGIILLLIGIDSSGKSSFLMRLRNVPGSPPKSGWGFSVDMVQYQVEKSWWTTKRKMVKIYDLGGDKEIRGIWKNYLAEVHGCIYVVDGDDKRSIDESKDALIDIYKNAKLMGKPLLLAINHKRDINLQEIVSRMNLHVLFPKEEPTNSLKILPCNVNYDPHNEPHIDPRIREGFNWIVESVLDQMKTLESRRLTDIKQEGKEKQEKKRKMIPIKNAKGIKSKVVPL